eukprot:TRINITY_DN80654_c0_g1_i1.p1 TRINITY_DN80654_c0_g1~~TRINITY_DN80654_c0_g1_i1.p1  ORF type:complete len:851 (+),score=253.84 TRINITY_DN80654_c0_g1_i1:110-2662(+)
MALLEEAPLASVSTLQAVLSSSRLPPAAVISARSVRLPSSSQRGVALAVSPPSSRQSLQRSPRGPRSNSLSSSTDVLRRRCASADGTRSPRLDPPASSSDGHPVAAAPPVPARWLCDDSPAEESSIKVLVRFRPPDEADRQREECAPAFLVWSDRRTVQSLDHAHSFEFDRAFDQDCSQQAIYEAAGSPMVEDLLAGYNGTVLAYGQTGSGKSYCMFGPVAGHSNGGHGRSSDVCGEPVVEAQRGVVQRTSQHLFAAVRAAKASGVQIVIRCALFEIYREQLRDLLAPSGCALRVKEACGRGIYIDGLSEEVVSSEADINQLVKFGCRMRAVAATQLNQHSSRSHVIFSVDCEQYKEEALSKVSKLHLVDLAGSEKVWKSSCWGVTLEEAKKINWSLSALGNVISALAEKRPHVPYRDSKLTRILQETLGGNFKTSLIVTCSPLHKHFDETLSSLNFAARVKTISNKVRVNVVPVALPSETRLAQSLRRQLRRTLREISLRGGGPDATRDEAATETTVAALSCVADSTEATREALEGCSVNIERQIEELRRTISESRPALQSPSDETDVQDKCLLLAVDALRMQGELAASKAQAQHETLALKAAAGDLAVTRHYCGHLRDLLADAKEELEMLRTDISSSGSGELLQGSNSPTGGSSPQVQVGARVEAAATEQQQDDHYDLTPSTPSACMAQPPIGAEALQQALLAEQDYFQTTLQRQDEEFQGWMLSAQRRLDNLDAMQNGTLQEEKRLQGLLKRHKEALRAAEERGGQARLRRQLAELRETQLQDAVERLGGICQAATSPTSRGLLGTAQPQPAAAEVASATKKVEAAVKALLAARGQAKTARETLGGA